MKNLKNLNGAKALSKNEQKSINGGRLSHHLNQGCSFDLSNCGLYNNPFGYTCHTSQWTTDDFGTQTTICCCTPNLSFA